MLPSSKSKFYYLVTICMSFKCFCPFYVETVQCICMSVYIYLFYLELSGIFSLGWRNRQNRQMHFEVEESEKGL